MSRVILCMKPFWRRLDWNCELLFLCVCQRVQPLHRSEANAVPHGDFAAFTSLFYVNMTFH